MRKLGLHLSVEYKILASDVITASYQRMFLYFKLFKAVVHTVPRYSSFECRSCPPFPLHDGILGLLIIVLDFLREGCILGFTSPLTSLTPLKTVHRTNRRTPTHLLAGMTSAQSGTPNRKQWENRAPWTSWVSNRR